MDGRVPGENVEEGNTLKARRGRARGLETHCLKILPAPCTGPRRIGQPIIFGRRGAYTGPTMAIRREKRGNYLIEASASRLPGNLWQPRLMMTRLAVAPALGRCQAFPGLGPACGSAALAMEHALALGRQLADDRPPRLTV